MEKLFITNICLTLLLFCSAKQASAVQGAIAQLVADQAAREALIEDIRSGSAKPEDIEIACKSELLHPNMHTGGDATPLVCLAVQSGNHQNVATLLACGAKIDSQDRFKCSALHFLPYKKISADPTKQVEDSIIQIIDLLLAYGADIDAKNGMWRTALMLSAFYLNAEKVAVHLIDHGADVNAQSLFEYTPSMLAVVNRNPTFLKLLIDANANLSTRNWNSKTALRIVSSWEHQSQAVTPADKLTDEVMTTMLIKAGAHF